MAFSVGEISAKVSADDKPFMRSIDRVHKKGIKVSRQLGDSFTNIGRKMTMGLTVPMGIAGGAMIKMASDAEETSAKFNTVFSSISEDAQRSANVLTKSFGLSKQASEELLGTTGDLLTGFGFTQDSALELSEEVNKLAVDLASFTNFSGGAEGASQALTKALLGERESVKSLGISILEADVNAKILENTQKGLTFETNRQAKAYATLQLAQEQSKNAIGDFARTQDSFANQMRQLRAEVSDLAVEFGRELLPIAKDVLSVARDMVSGFSGLSDESKQLGLKIAGIATVAGPTLWFFGKMNKALSSMLILLPKVTTAQAALNTTLKANVFVAVGAAFATIATKAFLASKNLNEFNASIKDLKTKDLDELNGVIISIEERIKEVSKRAISTGVDAGTHAEITRLREELERAVIARDQFAKKQIDQVISKEATDRLITSAVALNRFVNTDFSKLDSSALHDVANAAERIKIAVSQPVNNIIDPSEEARLRAMREEFAVFSNALYVAQTQTHDFSFRLGESADETADSAEKSGQAMMGLTNTIGTMFERAVLHGNNLKSVLSGIVKQLASKAFVTGIGSLLTGGASLGGKSFLSNVFGGLLHSGGMVSGGGDRTITAKGGEGVFTKGQMAAMGLMVRSGGDSMSEDKVKRAFDSVFAKYFNKLGPEEIFAMSQKGKYSY